MLKILLLILLLAFACAAAMALMARLSRISSQLGDLHRDMARNEAELKRRVAVANAEHQKNQTENSEEKIG